MKLKKFLAVVAAFSMVAATLTVAPAQADAPKANVYLEDAGTVTAGTTTFAVVDVYLTIPETLAAYAENEPDWENTFEYTYTGKVIQTAGIDIPYVDGLQFVAARSTVYATGWTKTANATAQQASISFAGTANFAESYSGDLGKIASLQYRITDAGVADVSKLAVKQSSFIVDIYSWAGTENATPTSTKYMSSNNNVDFTKPVPPTTKYAVNFDPADVTVTLGGTPIAANSEVDANETVNVAVVAKSGYTAQLKCNGTNADEGDFPVDQPLEFTVEYTLIPDPVSEYNFNVKDYGSSESAEAIYYKLGIFNSDTMMTLGLAGGKAFTAKNIPKVKGELELTMTYVMTGVPASIRASIPAVTSLTGVNNGEVYEEVK